MPKETKDKFSMVFSPGGSKRETKAGGQECPRRFCELDIPYPEPRVVAPNLYYADLLLEDFSGMTSEMTAVTQYMYHHFTLLQEYPEVAELQECLAIVEMKHMELLAETIILLGGDPRYWYPRNNRMVYWNGTLPYYGRGICDRLAADIVAEEGAIRQYRAHQAMIKDPYIDELLDRIILDEQHHLNLFTEAFEKHCHRK